MAGGGRRRTGPSSPARLALLLVMLLAAAAEAKVVHVEEAHRRSMLANGLGSAPPMGWNSWNHFQCDGNGEVVIRETADALVSTGLAALGYKYVNIDDCWAEPKRDAMGNLVANTKTFPHGIKALADYVHSKGLKLGIYSDAGYHEAMLCLCLCLSGRQTNPLGFFAELAVNHSSLLFPPLRNFSLQVPDMRQGPAGLPRPRGAGRQDLRDMGSGLPQVRQLQQRRPQAAGEVPGDEQGPDEGRPAHLLLAVRMGRHAPGAVGRGLRQQLEDDQRHRRHLGEHDRDGGPERGVGGVRAPRRLERSGHAGGGQRGDEEQRVRRALQPLGDLQGAAHHRLRREAQVAGDVRHPGQQGGDRRQPRSARRAGEEGEDGREQRDLGGAALRVPDGGGAAEPARDRRGHDHRALGRHRPPRRHRRRGQGPVAAQNAGRRVHGQDGVRRRAAVVQDVRAQAQQQAPVEAERGGGPGLRGRRTLPVELPKATPQRWCLGGYQANCLYCYLH